MQRAERPWYEKAAIWAALGLLVALSVIVANSWRAEPTHAAPSPPLSQPPGAGGATPAAERSDAEAYAVAKEDDAAANGNRSGASQAERASRDCKRAPIRGCAPSKDQQGCYHCSRCWRPFHYDVDHPPSTVSFACPDMPDAPLYVELSDASVDAGTVQRWTVSVSFDGRQLEREVTPNLGGVFFAGFHGGNVELRATMKACDVTSAACRGDVDVTVNARPDDPR